MSILDIPIHPKVVQSTAMKVLSNHSKGTLAFKIDVDANTNVSEVDSRQCSISSVSSNKSSNSNSPEAKNAETEIFAVNKGKFIFKTQLFVLKSFTKLNFSLMYPHL